MHRNSNTRRLQGTSATGTGKAAGAMTWRLLTRCLEQNKVEIKQKSLEALRLLRQADHALDKICKYLADHTEYV